VPLIEQDVEVVNKFGLHARPAMVLVQQAGQFASAIEIVKGDLTVDAKSIMSVMRLAAIKGTVLSLRAEGSDAAEAVEVLTKLIAGGFGELDQA
jgi:phosphotransferase system HPr (HPr) family protein